MLPPRHGNGTGGEAERTHPVDAKKTAPKDQDRRERRHRGGNPTAKEIGTLDGLSYARVKAYREGQSGVQRAKLFRLRGGYRAKPEATERGIAPLEDFRIPFF